jgi:hypothetical protein
MRSNEVEKWNSRICHGKLFLEVMIVETADLESDDVERIDAGIYAEASRMHPSYSFAL